MTNLNSQKEIKKIIGKVVGPGEESIQVRIQTRDNECSLIGEYLYYKNNENSPDVFLIITGRKITRTLPSTYMADPDVEAHDIAYALGLDNSRSEIEYELTANVIGYFDTEVDALVNPRINPVPDTPVFLATDEQLKKILFHKKEKDLGGMGEIGSLLFRKDVKASINTNEMMSTHFAILAGTGAGKSYLARVIIEELMMPYNGAAICIFDPHGEYKTLDDINKSSEFRINSTDSSQYKPKVQVLQLGENLSINVNDLDIGELKTLLYNPSEKMELSLSKAVMHVKNMNKGNFSYKALRKYIDDEKEFAEESGNKSDSLSSLTAISWRLHKRFDKSKIFKDDGGSSLSSIFEPGVCTVIDLSSADEEEQQVLAAVLLNKVFKARMEATRRLGTSDGQADNEISYPVFALLEEAHRFAPQGDSEKLSNSVLRKILGEGRKFGVGVGLITQRPGKLDQNVLSQCMSQFILRIVNPIDQESLKQGVEAAGRDLLKELPSLSKGQVIVSGSCVRTPVLIKVRKAKTRHGGETLKFSEEWKKYSKEKKIREAVRQPLGDDSENTGKRALFDM